MPNERATFQQLAQLRLSEAKALLVSGQPSGAYYLAGYCVECALKAIIAKQFRGDEIPDKNLVNKIYTHDLSDLLRLAGLESELDAGRRADSELDRRWSIIKNWTEQARYGVWTKQQATAIIDAVEGDGRNGGFFSMAERSLVEQKLALSRELIGQLKADEAPLLAAYWELPAEKDRWIFYLVPRSPEAENKLVKATSKVMITSPYRSVFSLSDVYVDAHQIARARAIASYLRSSEDLGRQFDTTFTRGEYFESVIVLYVDPELQKAHHAA